MKPSEKLKRLQAQNEERYQALLEERREARKAAYGRSSHVHWTWETDGARYQRAHKAYLRGAPLRC